MSKKKNQCGFLEFNSPQGSQPCETNRAEQSAYLQDQAIKKKQKTFSSEAAALITLLIFHLHHSPAHC